MPTPGLALDLAVAVVMEVVEGSCRDC